MYNGEFWRSFQGSGLFFIKKKLISCLIFSNQDNGSGNIEDGADMWDNSLASITVHQLEIEEEEGRGAMRCGKQGSASWLEVKGKGKQLHW